MDHVAEVECAGPGFGQAYNLNLNATIKYRIKNSRT